MNRPKYPPLPVLLVDDESQALDSFEIALSSGSMDNSVRCQDSRDVMSLLSRQEFEAILLDLRMPHISGEDLLPTIVSDFPEVPVIIITGTDDIETAVKCMNAGAFDYMVKPVEKTRLITGVKRATELRALQRENQLLRDHVLSDHLTHPEAFSEIITNSRVMWSLFQYSEAIAKSPEPVLITGETGVGKELMARALHDLSQRSGKFIAVNVAGLDDNVFSDTLFGHRKGAFTGADQTRDGLVEKASGGTLFLDEIGDLSPPSQVKLLRLLQEREFFPLGSDLAKRSDAHIIVTTNQDLQNLLTLSTFRKDLYYRLRTHHINIPPLRDRKEDLPILLEYFLEKASEKLEKKKPTYPKELLNLLSVHHFPGNIRELESMVFDAVSTHRSGILSMDAFKSHISLKHSPIEPDVNKTDNKTTTLMFFPEQLPTLKQAEQLLVAEAMNRANGNQAIAAMSLGISRQALNSRLKRNKQ